jgi:uncharacterized iron-regulated protein
VSGDRTPDPIPHPARGRRWFVRAVAWLGVGLCVMATAHADGPEGPWQAPHGREHPLVGRIWDVAAARFIEAATLVSRLAAGRFVLLGEKHDNPDHHRLQAWVLGKLIDAGRRPAVGFEMFTVDDAPAIARYVAAHPKDAAGLGEAVAWARRGWPAWALYQPIADLALRAGLPLVATDLSPSTVRGIGGQGLDALAPDLVRRLGLDRPLPADLRAMMAEEIRRAHCGYASDARVEAMIDVQRARDAQMAERLAAAGKPDGAVLIAGAGHVRHDYGVPVYLRDRVTGAAVMTVAFLEVSPHGLEPAAYAGRFHRPALPFDYVWFTPRVDDDDPCEKFEEQLQKLRKGP